jgi:transcriptional regulator with PAS, ATPase and Fis domain
LQAKLLRVLEDQVIRRVGGVRDIQVDVRVIAASNRDLERAVRETHFRQDLYYRLAIISIFIPPLRERKEDLPPLVEFFIDHYNRKFRKSVRGISEDARRLLLNYDWPGNVRELKNAIERALLFAKGDEITAKDLPESVRAPAADAGSAGAGLRSLEEIERDVIQQTLEATRYKIARSAEILGISRKTLLEKRKKYGLA